MVAGKEVTPSDAVDTERLKAFWTEGRGATQINWGVPGDFDRCRVLLGRFIHNPEQLAGYCANLHKRATGAWPGHAPAELAAKAAEKAARKEAK